MRKNKPQADSKYNSGATIEGVIGHNPYLKRGVALEGLMSNLSASGDCLSPFENVPAADPMLVAAMECQAQNHKRATLDWLSVVGTLLTQVPVGELEERTFHNVGFLIEHLAEQAINMEFIESECRTELSKPHATAQ